MSIFLTINTEMPKWMSFTFPKVIFTLRDTALCCLQIEAPTKMQLYFILKVPDFSIDFMVSVLLLLGL